MSDTQSSGSIATLTADECWQLVQATTIGRLGFVRDGEILIIPVNYFVDQTIHFRTLPDGILAGLADGPRITFQIDHHDASGTGWSVLVHGTLARVDPAELQTLSGANRVLPWAGGERDLGLRLISDRISGRRVRRRRNT